MQHFRDGYFDFLLFAFACVYIIYVKLANLFEVSIKFQDGLHLLRELISQLRMQLGDQIKPHLMV